MLISSRLGSVQTTLLVVLVFFVFTTSLFVFMTSETRVQTQLQNDPSLDHVIIEASLSDAQLTSILSSSMIQAYSDILKEDRYFGGSSQGTSLVVLADFKGTLEKYFNQAFYASSPDEDYLLHLRERIVLGEFTLVSSGNSIEVSVKEFPFTYMSESINLTYTPDLVHAVSFEELGLEPFSDILSLKESCKDVGKAQEIEECFNQGFSFFDVHVVKGTTSNTFDVILTSKKSFVVGKRFERMTLEFTLL